MDIMLLINSVGHLFNVHLICLPIGEEITFIPERPVIEWISPSKISFKHQFENQCEGSYDQVLFFGVNNNQFQILKGDIGGSSEWETVYDNEITFEFKAAGEISGGGFYLFLMCK